MAATFPKAVAEMNFDTPGETARAEPRTKGEWLFEQYLQTQGIPNFEYEKEHLGKRKRPDYTVTLDREYLFDVKDFTYVEIPPAGSYDPHRRLRQKIGDLRDQFREYKNWPCCAVLYNDNAPLVDLNTPMIVFGAMYGDLGITMQINTTTGQVVEGSERQQFLSRGKMLLRSIKSDRTEVRNTTISALITLRHVRTGYARLCNDLRDRKEQQDFSLGDWVGAERDFDQEEEHLGVIVWENAFARIPFPRDLFRGDYDERYGLDEESYLSRIHIGRGILEYEELIGDKTSPLFTKRPNCKEWPDED
jgi:hypothetical protein